jgi:hypothetical protein
VHGFGIGFASLKQIRLVVTCPFKPNKGWWSHASLKQKRLVATSLFKTKKASGHMPL